MLYADRKTADGIAKNDIAESTLNHNLYLFINA